MPRHSAARSNSTRSPEVWIPGRLTGVLLRRHIWCPSRRRAGLIRTVTAPEAAVIQALKGGEKDRNAVLKSASQNLGRARLGPSLRLILENAVENLVARKVILSEESELFLGEQARNASFSSDNMPYEARRSYGRRRRYSRFRPRRW